MVRNTSQKYERNKLNEGQFKVLELVYKYRFVSRQLLADSLGVKSGSGLHEKLEVLVKNAYLGKRSDKQQRLQHVPVAYFLTPKGVKALQMLPDHEFVTERMLQESYRDKSIVGNGFIGHSLNIYKYTLRLQKQYPELKVFTQRDISRYSYFPKHLPDAFLSLATDTPSQPQRFFFDIVRDRAPRRELEAKLRSYIEFFDEGGWDVTGSELPIILLICEWSASEKSVQRSIAALAGRVDAELSVYTSTISALGNAISNAVWTDITDPDELQSLDAIAIFHMLSCQ